MSDLIRPLGEYLSLLEQEAFWPIPSRTAGPERSGGPGLLRLPERGPRDPVSL